MPAEREGCRDGESTVLKARARTLLTDLRAHDDGSDHRAERDATPIVSNSYTTADKSMRRDAAEERALVPERGIDADGLTTHAMPPSGPLLSGPLRQAQDALRASENQLYLITENLPAMIVYFDRNFVCRFANSQYASFFGFTRETILGRHLSEVMGAANFLRTAAKFQQVLDGKSVIYERAHRDDDGRTRHVRVSFAPETDASGAVVGSYALVSDITEYKGHEDAVRNHALQQEAIAVYVQYALEEREIEELVANAAAMTTSGLDVTHSAVYRVAPEGDDMMVIAGVGWDSQTLAASQLCAIRAETARFALTSGQAVVRERIEDSDVAGEDSLLSMEHLCSSIEVVIPTSEGPFGVIGAYSREPGRFGKDDESFVRTIATALGTAIGRKRADERVAYVAQFDSLTGLPNRVLFRDRLSQAMSRAERNQSLLALMFLDLDRFKEINDTVGHKAGDRLLQSVAERLKGALRTADTVARLGGDEFTVILEDIESPEAANEVIQKLLDVLTRPFALDGHEFFVTVSAGISLYPLDRGDIETLIMNADIAMYHAKDRGKNNYQFYRPEMNALKQEARTIESHLRRALERDELSLQYQPQVELKTGKVVAVEALLRWNHPELGSISPERFIPVAEQTGLIVELGKWVLRTACEQNLAWQRAGYAPIRVAVNVSARQFRTDLYDTVAAVVRESGLYPGYLEIEITEGFLVEDPKAATAMLLKLRTLGVHVAIDDFGSGYSSLSYLKHFPIDRLKIDRSFVRDISIDLDDAAISKAVIALAHSLDLQVVAEGVETGEQVAFLRAYQCDIVQGYLYSQPIDADEVAIFLGHGVFPRTGSPALLPAA
jgi:diguanylate cyclase (GGDEF)-like protein/PAS domain S-box-containing protein